MLFWEQLKCCCEISGMIENMDMRPLDRPIVTPQYRRNIGFYYKHSCGRCQICYGHSYWSTPGVINGIIIGAFGSCMKQFIRNESFTYLSYVTLPIRPRTFPIVYSYVLFFIFYLYLGVLCSHNLSIAFSKMEIEIEIENVSLLNSISFSLLKLPPLDPLVF